MSFLHDLFSIRGKTLNKQSLTNYAKELQLSTEAHEQSIGLFFLQWLNNESHITVTTSGTTSDAKQLSFKKEALVSHARMSATYFNQHPKETIAQLLSADFIAAKMILVRAMVVGLDLWFYKPSKAPLAGLDKTFDWTSLVPFQLLNSLEDLYKVKKILIGGAPMSFETQKKAALKARQQDCKLYVSFGMTETLSHIAIAPLTDRFPLLYKALPNVVISKNRAGCLCVNAPYLDFDIQTSDLIEIVNQDSFYWQGRADNLVNSGGVKLQPEQIEQELCDQIKSPFFITGLDDEVLGQKLCLVAEAGQEKSILNSLKDFSFATPYHKPKSILVVSAFRYTASEKLKRKETLMGGYKEIPVVS